MEIISLEFTLLIKIAVKYSIATTLLLITLIGLIIVAIKN